MNKLSIRVAADPEQLEWVKEKVKAGVFASRSHAYRFALGELMRLDKLRRDSLKPSSQVRL